MTHDVKISTAAALLLERHGQAAPDVARQWARGLTERRDQDAAAMCLDIADAAEKLLGARAAQEPTLGDVLNGAVTGQMMRADQVERRDVEHLMKRAKNRSR
jgi:hypothetical protein